MPDEIEFDFEKMRRRAGGFPPEAFEFVREGLAHTVKSVHGGDAPAHGDESHHVSGQQLCEGLREFALEQYGRLALMVLHHWGVRETADFGRIVFAMVDAGLMRKTEEDTLEDFANVFDFDEAFGETALGRS